MKGWLLSVAGRSIVLRDLNQCIAHMIDLWLSSCHMLTNGEAGWYRRLAVTDRVGNVATAQAVQSLLIAGKAPPRVEAVVRTLLRHRQPDGAWPFASNLTKVGVVDSTAYVLLSLCALAPLCPTEAVSISNAVTEGLDWLERVALPGGGWGLIEGSPLRPYSTALALEALCAGGRKDGMVFQHGVQKLVEVADPSTGGWYDSCRQLSIPATARVALALVAISRHQPIYERAFARPISWLRKVGRESLLWSSGAVTASHEEVEVQVGGDRVRIEYRHSSKPLAITALVAAGWARYADVCLAVRQIIKACAAGDWSAAGAPNSGEAASWMLHDVVVALTSFRAALGDEAAEVWVHRGRVVIHPYGRRKIVKLLVNHRAKVITLGGCALLAWVLVKGGLVPTFNFAMIWFVVGSVSLNLIASFVYEFWRGGADDSVGV